MKELLTGILMDLQVAFMNPPKRIFKGSSGKIHERTPVEIALGSAEVIPNKHLEASLNPPGAIRVIPERSPKELVEQS